MIPVCTALFKNACSVEDVKIVIGSVLLLLQTAATEDPHHQEKKVTYILCSDPLSRKYRKIHLLALTLVFLKELQRHSVFPYKRPKAAAVIPG